MWRTLMGFALCLSISTTVKAEIYKWADAKGVVHYEDAPPKVGAETIDLPPLSILNGFGDLPPPPAPVENTHSMSNTSSSSSASSPASSAGPPRRSSY
jgi:hypothetical protein